MDHAISEELPAEVGVPQGSVLGPIAYALDLTDLNLNGRMLHY